LADVLLSRYAENLFWLARYVERAENLARILDVNETFSRDSRGGQNWRSVLQLYGDEARFKALHGTATAESVLRFYVTDAANPTSIVSAVRSARENARALRPLISNEMWTQVNVLHNRLGALGDGALAAGNRARLFGQVKEACQTHVGVMEGTFYRGQGWHFCRMGRYIERADQTTRLLDIKYHLLLPNPGDVGSPLDVSQWNALLRSAAGYQAFRQIHPEGITPRRVAGFLLLDARFPRSVALCVREAGMLLDGLRSSHNLRGGTGAAEELDRLHAVLSAVPIGEVLKKGLHQFLDVIQRQLIAVTDDLAGTFFGHGPAQGQSQSQSQSGPSGSQSQSQSQSQPGDGFEWWPPLPPLSPPAQS
jgi:uncharacterized alpha-E superfamily protein